MTNKEWIESQNLSFSEGLKFWNKDKHPDFSEWLKAERTYKFKVGDIVCGKTGANFLVNVIIGIDANRYNTCFFTHGRWQRSIIPFGSESEVYKIGTCDDMSLLS